MPTSFPLAPRDGGTGGNPPHGPVLLGFVVGTVGRRFGTCRASLFRSVRLSYGAPSPAPGRWSTRRRVAALLFRLAAHGCRVPLVGGAPVCRAGGVRFESPVSPYSVVESASPCRSASRMERS